MAPSSERALRPLNPTHARSISSAEAGLVRKLRRRKERDRSGLVLAEGVRCVREALDAGWTVRLALVSPRLDDTNAGKELEARLRSSVALPITVSDAELKRLSDTDAPQGVLLVVERPAHSLDLPASARRLLVLDGVQDPGNVGTLVRSSHAFGLDAVVALPGTADPWSPKVVRSSAGSVFHASVVALDRARLLGWLRANGVGLIVAEASAGSVRGGGSNPSVGLGALPAQIGGRSGLPRAWALVVGNEGAGVSAELAAGADLRVSIPIEGAESLNAGVAGSILLYEFTRNRESR